MAFAWGAVPAAILAAISQLVLAIPTAMAFGTDPFAATFVQAAFFAPITEEIAKGLAVGIVFWFRRYEFDGWVDGIVYGAMAGLGFAYVENVIYLLNTESWSQWANLFFVRSIAFGGLHAFWTALVGIGFGIARYQKRVPAQILVLALGLLAAMFGHSVHNAASTLAAVTAGATMILAFLNYSVLFLGMIVLRVVAKRVELAHMRTYLANEVPDTMSQDLFDLVTSPRRRRERGGAALPANYRYVVQTCAELTQKKLQLERMGDENGNRNQINALRTELARVNQRWEKAWATSDPAD